MYFLSNSFKKLRYVSRINSKIIATDDRVKLKLKSTFETVPKNMYSSKFRPIALTLACNTDVHSSPNAVHRSAELRPNDLSIVRRKLNQEVTAETTE